MSCRDVEDALVDLTDGRLDAATELRLHDHVETCAACRERAALWGALVPSMRALEPKPPTPIRLRRMEVEIERRLAAEPRELAPPRGRKLWIGLTAAVAAAAMLLVLIGLRHRAPGVPAPPAFATVKSHTGTAEALGTHLAAGSRVVVPNGGETQLELACGASLTLSGPGRLVLGGETAHVALLLEEGRLEVAVTHRRAEETFSVALPDGRVDVRGTRFVVVAKPSESWVRVTEGRVAAFDRDGREHGVDAGETHWFAAPELPAPAPPPSPATRDASCEAPRTDCAQLTRAVRKAMRIGQYPHALGLLDSAARVSAGCPRWPLTCRDELGYLRAEALRASGRLDAAVSAYKLLDRRDAPPATRQNALYAAAQLERRLGNLGAARSDYERALAAAPRGALREEVMLGALEAAELAGDGVAELAAARRYLSAFPEGIGARDARRVEAKHRSENGSAP